MRIAGVYSFNNGERIVKRKYPGLYREIKDTISKIDASACKKKESKEKTMPGMMLSSPVALNNCFKERFYSKAWESIRVKCDYPVNYYTGDYTPKKSNKGTFREMDFVKNRVGVEVQFGKYAFMVYNVAAKMTIFRNLGIINVGIEIVPVREFALQMSTGVSYFEQFVWDLEQRGTSDIDIPVMVLGIMSA